MGAAPILTILKNGETIKSIPIEGEALLGRGEGCVIRLEDRLISRHHALFKPTSGGAVQVEKKSEFAPLLVNGADCTSAVLKEGDVIAIGPYLMRVSAGGQTEDSISETATMMPDFGAPTESPADGMLALAPSSEEELAADANVIQLGSPSEALQTPTAESLPEVNLSLSSPAELSEMIDDDAKTKLTPQAKLAVKLVFKPGDANVTELEFTQDEISIGRGQDCDVVLNDKKASRRHCLIRRAGLNFIIKDLESANGTSVNGQKITEQELTGDDKIRIGAAEFQFKAMSADYVNQGLELVAPVQEVEASPDAIPEFSADLPSIDQPSATQVPMQMPDGSFSVEGGQPAQAVANAVTNPGLAVGNASGVPAMQGIPGLTGVPGLGGASGGKQSLLEKFRALPKQKQMIYGIVGLAALYFLVLDDQSPVMEFFGPTPAPKVEAKPVNGTKPTPTFASLTPEQKRFVETQNNLAMDYFQNKDYDKALFEVRKIFQLIPEYKNARELEKYAQEGKRLLEALQEEKKRKEDEQRLKAKVADMESEAQTRVEKKQFEQAKELFSQILALDPDNAKVASWRKLVDDYDERMKLDQQQKQVQEEINRHGWEMYSEGMQAKKRGRYHEAIATFQKVIDIGASNPKVLKLSKRMIAACYNIIRARRTPLLAEAKQAEDAQDFTKAYQLYLKATIIDPPHPAGYQGMARVRGVLHEKAKQYYTEAILAESYSDFVTARKKFQDVLDTAPVDDTYHERAQRKLARYFNKKEDTL